jgi:protein-S-isoprenylcysteine O-methyltransferase Ste14
MRHTPSPRWRQMAAFLLNLCLLILAAHVPMPLPLPREFWKTLGTVCLAAGGAVWLAALMAMPGTYRIQGLVTGGIFALVRHPRYLAGILVNFGLVFLLHRYALCLAVALLSTGLWYEVACLEERDLERVFGDEYTAYRQRVGMFLPRIRRKEDG